VINKHEEQDLMLSRRPQKHSYILLHGATTQKNMTWMKMSGE